MEGYEERGRAPEDVDEYYDYLADYGRSATTNWNLKHLSLSDAAQAFFKSNKILEDFAPLVDQIMATNNLDWSQAEYYKYLVDEMVLKMFCSGKGGTERESRLLRVARTYMHNIIDGCRGGYRGKLVTELRRVYRREAGEPEKKRGWFW